MTVRELLDRHVAGSPDAPAVRAWRPAGWASTTWRELRQDALASQSGVERLTGRRDSVILVVDNGAASAATLLGLVMAGRDALLVERDQSWLTDERSIVHRVGATTLVADGLATAPGRYRCLGLDELLSSPPSSGRGEAAPGESSLLQLTSGSTGEPRAADQPAGNALRGGALYRDLLGLRRADRVLVTIPLAHSFGLVGGLFAALVAGAGLLVLTRFHLRAVEEALDAGATVMLGTPLVYSMVGRLRPGQGRALRMAVSSGGPLPAAVAAAAGERLRCPVRQVYGSTEMGLVAHQLDGSNGWPDGCVGVPAPGVRCRIRADDGNEETTREGRLFVRTSTMFRGYVGSGHPVLLEDGFYDTGDVAHVDASGRLFIDGRKDTFVNVGGRKVNPRRVERMLAQHPSVRDVVVYGLDSTHGNQEIHAAVALGVRVTAQTLVRFCRSRLSAYEVPRVVHVVDEVPRTTRGKVDRSRLPGRQ